MSRRIKHNLLTIEKTDQMYDLPEHWSENNEAIVKALDHIEDEIREIKEEIECLKRYRFSP